MLVHRSCKKACINHNSNHIYKCSKGCEFGIEMLTANTTQAYNGQKLVQNMANAKLHHSDQSGRERGGGGGAVLQHENSSYDGFVAHGT